METIPLELRKLGLTEKEVKVYLAGLELGPSSVQKLSGLARLPRPTAYEMIKKLEKKELFIETKEGSKRYFSAQSPERILGILKTQKKEIEEKEREFVRIISALETKFSKEKEGVRVFKGAEGIKSLEETVSFSSTPEILIVNLNNIPIKSGQLAKMLQAIKKRLGRVEVKQIKAKIGGSLIVFDKVVFFPKGKQEGYLLS